MALLSDTQGKGEYHFKIKVAGADLPAKYVVTSIVVSNEINRIPTAEISIKDGNPLKSTFDASASSTFDPGKEIEISLGKGTKIEKVFSGIISKHSLKISDLRTTLLVLEAKAKALKMTVSRTNAVYDKKTDKDVMTALLGNHGLSNSVGATSGQFPKLVQYQCSDWDFMLTRADVNGMTVVVDETGKVIIEKPKASTAGKIEIKYGVDIIDFDGEIDARYQYKDVQSTGWDYSQQKAVTGKSAEPTVNSHGTLDGSKLAKVLDSQTYYQFSPIKAEQAFIKSWSDSQLLRSRLSRIRGRMKVFGVNGIKPGTTVKLTGFGDKFNGNAFVSGVTHTLQRGGWITELYFGLQSKSFSEKNDIHIPPASGITPAVNGLQIGVVTSIEDKTGEFMVMVKIPYLDDTLEYAARLSHLYASNASGIYFMPEVNDEVVLGFMNNDPNCPIIMGSMHSSKNKSPETPEKKNDIKGIMTKSKMKISFAEEDKIITIETPGKNTIIISDKDKSITIKDQNNNKIELGSAGITLDSGKDVIIKAKGKISLASTTEVGIEAKTDVKVAGMNITNEAKVKFSGKGNAQAELNSTGQTVVKGSIVMIN